MAEVLGAMSILDKALPTGVDGTRLAEWSMRDGITYGELANTLSLALGAANTDLIAKWGWLISLTEELFMEYPNGGSVTPMQELTDQDRPQPRKGTTLGHMIELHNYGDAVGGTRKYFRDVRSAQIMAAVRDIVNRGIWRFEQKILERWFTNTEIAIGAAGYNVPFVRGSAGAIDFAPPPYDGQAFDTSHNHYIGVNLSTPKTHADLLNSLADTLAEHGHTAPYTAMVSQTDVESYGALTGWVELVEPVISLVDRGGATTGAQYFATGSRDYMQIGFFHSKRGLVQVRASNRLATGYAGMCKSYGQLDSRNPLAVRVHPSQGFGMLVVPETTLNDDVPVKQLDVELEFGVGVGMDRTNGAAAYLVAGGSWSNPVIG